LHEDLVEEEWKAMEPVESEAVGSTVRGAQKTQKISRLSGV